MPTFGCRADMSPTYWQLSQPSLQCSKVLSGGGIGYTALRQQDMGPCKDCLGESRGVSHPCSQSDGKEAYAAEGPGAHLIYSKSKDVLEECGMHTLEEYIRVHGSLADN